MPRTTNAEIDARRMMSEEAPPYNIYDASGPWGSHSMRYDPRSLDDWNGNDYMHMMSEAPPYNIYDASGPWGSHSMRYHPVDYSFYDRFSPSNSNGDASEGGKKRKNTIKQRKSRNQRKSRRH